MATTRVVWDGLAEYRAELERLPETCTGEAAHLIEGEVNAAEVAIRRAYPVRTGHLRDGMEQAPLVIHQQATTGRVLRNRAPHAHLFEWGTQARHTSLGANRGTMPPGHVFVPVVVRARRTIVDLLKAMVLRQGATAVTGDA